MAWSPAGVLASDAAEIVSAAAVGAVLECGCAEDVTLCREKRALGVLEVHSTPIERQVWGRSIASPGRAS